MKVTVTTCDICKEPVPDGEGLHAIRTTRDGWINTENEWHGLKFPRTPRREMILIGEVYGERDYHRQCFLREIQQLVTMELDEPQEYETNG